MLRRLLFAAPLALAACSDSSSEPDTTELRKGVLANYGELVYLNYKDALDTALALQVAIDTQVASPSEANLQAARQAWLDARIPYGQSEAFRFYGGPIDGDDGPEDHLNGWPLDERFIDYVDGDDSSGIVNDPAIELTKERLLSLTSGGEGDVFGEGTTFDPDKAIATGYHAVEFLLWGQDMSTTGPGARPFEDYLTDASATHPNGDRRGQYLQVATQLLVDDLTMVTDAWAPDADNFRKSFVEDEPDRSLARIIASLGILSKGELAGERMDVALDSLDQEDEQSCFSDNTHVDLHMDALGIQNVYLGRYGDHDGPGLDELLAVHDPALGDDMSSLIQTSIDAITAIPTPFDQAIAMQGSPAWNQIDTAVGHLFDQGDSFVLVGEALGLGTISVEEPQ